jgi:hypothetical protein
MMIHKLVNDVVFVRMESGHEVYRVPWELFATGINFRSHNQRLRIYLKTSRIRGYLSIASPKYWFRGVTGLQTGGYLIREKI